MATASMIPAGSPRAQRPHAANVYKSAGVKPIQTSIAWVDGGSKTVDSRVDLALPIRGFRLVLKGRMVVGVAGLTAVNPEGFLNLIKNIKIEGTNSRQGGNTTLWDLDLATLFTIQHFFAHRAGSYDINGTSGAIPGLPIPAGWNPTGVASTYDYRIIVDLPAHPFGAGPGVRPGYLIRKEEWADTLSVAFAFGTQAGGAVTGSLGTGAAGTTITNTSFGSGAGTPTIDLYSLPVQMGHLRNQVVPGVCTRVSREINTILTAAGNNITLQQLQRRRTSRVYLKTGTSLSAPAFNTLTDTNVTAVGLQTGAGDRQVKPLVDIFAYKMDQAADYKREPIQGYTCFDFLQSGNPDSAFAANSEKVVGSGSTFDLVANVAGVATGYGIVVQEQITHLHGGALYNY